MAASDTDDDTIISSALLIISVLSYSNKLLIDTKRNNHSSAISEKLPKNRDGFYLAIFSCSTRQNFINLQCLTGNFVVQQS